MMPALKTPRKWVNVTCKVPSAQSQSIVENTLKSLTILVIISGQHQVLEDTIQNEYFGLFTNERETSRSRRAGETSIDGKKLRS